MLFRKPACDWIVVGLGNPGDNYARTRHNAGFRAVDRLAAMLNVKIDRAKFRGLTAQAVWQGQKLLLVKPQTFMNESGLSVMDAARSAGAGGGTVLHAKGTGRARAQKFFGVSLADEKDVVYIVAHADEKAAIMQAIADNAGPGTRAGAICFSLPISQVAGLRERDE